MTTIALAEHYAENSVSYRLYGFVLPLGNVSHTFDANCPPSNHQMMHSLSYSQVYFSRHTSFQSFPRFPRMNDCVPDAR